MTYTHTTLKTAIQDYTENSETTLVNNLDNFIKNTEERLLKLVDLDFFRKNATASTTSGNKFLAAPSDYLASFSLSIVKNNENVFLLQKDVNFLQEYTPNPSTTGTPKYYSLFDVDNFILAPTPDAAYTCELHYYYRPSSITGSAGTSWFGENAPDVLLYGCLVDAYTFMKGDPSLSQEYEKRFIEAATRLKLYAEGVENTDAYREGLTRVRKQ